MSQLAKVVSLAIVVALSAGAFAAPIAAQCPPKTTISDAIFNADGSAAAGRMVIAWPTFLAGSCQIIAGQASVTISGGQLQVELYPNVGATPTGTSYRVTYYLRSGRVSTEYWVVPASSALVSLAEVRAASVPSPSVMFGQAQVTNLVGDLAKKIELPNPCPAGKFLQANGNTSPPQVTCVDGTGAPTASPTQSGTVKTDVEEIDPVVYAKATLDVLLAAKAPTVHAHSAADVASGTLNPARLPLPTSTTLGAVKSGACSGSEKVTGIADSGVITCASDLTGSGSQHQVNGVALSASDPVNFQDSSSIAFSNPSAGNVQGAVKDGAITAAKLAVANPSVAQLAGIGNANIAAQALSPDRVSGVAVIQTRALNTTTPLSGGGDLSADRTISCPTCETTTNKGAASGYASLDASSKVVQGPASATATPGADKIVMADGTGKLAAGWLPNPGPGSKGGVEAKTCSSTDKISSIGTDGVPVCSTDQTGAATHNLLSSTHTDTTPGSVTRGDVIAGIGASPTWQRVAKGGTNAYPKWNASGDLISSTGAASGTGSCTNQFARTLNADAAPTCETVGTNDIAANAISNAKFRQSAGLSVIGRSANSTGDVADITGTDGQVFRVSGTALGFGTVATAGIANDAVTRDKVSAVLRTRQLVFLLGADNGAALADTDDQPTIFYNSLGQGVTITSVWCESDGGTPAIQLQKDDGSPTNMLSSNLTCSTSGASTSSFVSGENAIASTNRIDFMMVTAGGTAKRVTVVITYTVD